MKNYLLPVLCLAALFPAVIFGQSSGKLILDRKGQTIVLEPYAANVLRVTLSLQRENAIAKPGYGLIGTPDSEGWTSNQSDHADVYRSSRIIATVERPHPTAHPPLPTELDIAKFFNGSTPGAHITFTTPDGKTLLEMSGWDQAVPNHKDATRQPQQRSSSVRPRVLYRWRNLRFTGRRALLRPGRQPGRLSRSPPSSGSLLERLPLARGAQHLCAIHDHEQRLRHSLG